MHTDFSMKPNLKIRFDFSRKLNFRIKVDFSMKLNCRIAFDLSIKPVLENRLSIQLYSGRWYEDYHQHPVLHIEA